MPHRPVVAPVVLVVALALGACSSSKKAADPGPSCADVVDNIMKVTKEKLAGHGDLQVQNRSVMIQQCEKRKLSPEQRTCLAAAKDLNAIATCTPRPATPPRPATKAPAPPTPAPAAPPEN